VQVKGHAAGVVALGFSPDGRKLLSIGAEGLINHSAAAVN